MSDEESRKRGRYKKSHYVSNNKKRRVEKNLGIGMRGVLITCNDKKERYAVREAYNILNEYADKMYGKEMTNSNGSSSEEEDIEKAIAKEKQDMKNEFQRFQSVKCGAKNVLFIKTALPNDEDPTKLVHTVLFDMLENGLNKSRNCMRFLPVGACCYANIKEIETAAANLFKDSFLAPDAKPCKFCVVYKARNNGSIHRDDTIAALAGIVLNSGGDHSVDLHHPDLTICVEIVRTMCCLSVVKDFQKLKKYNIQEIQNSDKHSAPAEQKVIEKETCNSQEPEETVENKESFKEENTENNSDDNYKGDEKIKDDEQTYKEQETRNNDTGVKQECCKNNETKKGQNELKM